MYNDDRKKSFIDSYTNSQKTTSLIVQIFTWFEPYESEWGSDLSQQSSVTLQPVVDRISGLRSKSVELVLIILKEYVKWCARNGYQVSNGIYDVKVSAIDKIREQMVASPLHLKTILDSHFRPSDTETVDITYRVFLWMAFAGLSDREAIRVSSGDVDLENLRINFEGRSYEIYKECRLDFEKACNLKYFNYEHPDYETIQRDRVEGDLIMRGIRSHVIEIKTIRPVINKKLRKHIWENGQDKNKSKNDSQEDKLSYKRIYLSGIFYRAYEQEMAGLPVRFSEAVAIEMQRKESQGRYTLSKTRTLTTIANAIEREYISDYARWKCAFV